MIRSFTGILPACLCLLVPDWALGQPTLSWSEARERALAANPTLAAQVADSEVVQILAKREALAPPVTVGAELENFAGSGALGGLGAAEATLRLTRTLEMGGKRAARTALGDAASARARHRNEILRREIERQTRLRFIEVLADQSRLTVAREHVALAVKSRDEVARAVQRARNPETDLHTSELALADAELELEHAEHELAAARVTLVSSWGERQADFGEVRGDLDSLGALEPLDTLTARLDDSPAAAEARLAQVEAAARRELARANRLPDLNASLGVRRLEGMGDNALVASVSIALGAASRSGFEQRAAQATEFARTRDRAALATEQYQSLFEHYQEAAHARTEFEMLRDRMLPAAEKSLALARRGFEAGRFPFHTLAQSQEKLIELRRRQIDTAVRHHTLLAAIELLAGAPTGVNP